MKRFFSAALVVVLLIGLLPCNSFAIAYSENTEIIQLDDGGYVMICTETSPARASNTVNGSKTYNHYDSADNLLWRGKLTASYVFTG